MLQGVAKVRSDFLFFLLKLQRLQKLGVLFLIHFILNKTNISNQDGLLYFFNIF